MSEKDANRVLDWTTHKKGTQQVRYKRTRSTQRDSVCKAVDNLYDGSHSLLLSSGMNAIFVTLYTLCCKHGGKGTVLYSSELYCDTPSKVVPGLQAAFPATTWESLDTWDGSALMQAVRAVGSDLICLFTEGCSNPSGRMTDWDAVLEVPVKATVVVDNTWCSAAVFRPFTDVGRVDVVVESTSKYLSRGEAIGGIITFAKATGKPLLAEACLQTIKMMGIHVPEEHCDIISAGIDLLTATMENLGSKASAIAKAMERNSEVSTVLHPSLRSHPTHERFHALCKNRGAAPGVLLLHVPNPAISRSYEGIVRSAVESAGLLYATSFCTHRATVDSWPKYDDSRAYTCGPLMAEHAGTESKGQAADAAAAQEGRKGVWLRISAGLEEEAKTTVDKLARVVTLIHSARG